MRPQTNKAFRSFLRTILAAAVIGIFSFAAQGAKLSQVLRDQLTRLDDSESVGMVIVSFNSNNGLQQSHRDILNRLGITGGQTFQNLGMIAQPMTAGQARALASDPNVRSVWSNDRLFYTMNQARVLTDVDRLRTDSGNISRLDLAVAFVRAIGLDEAARAKTNTNVTYNGIVISDNAQIPGALRGYVQIAIDKGILETYEAQVIQTAPGQFTVLPGPRVEPNNTITRAALATKLNTFRQLFTTGG